MSLECYATVSDLALCQRCPALFAYKIHRREKSAWRVGIKGGGEAYGSVFHKEISEKFFHAASNPKSSLYDEINFAASEGADSLERFVREKIFLPFVETKGKFFTTAQILAMARAVRVWIRGMLIFFENSRPVFLKPEGKLEGTCNFQDSKLIITGRYDALIFNPERLEARLFEFKGFKKSDITVPLSQSLIYAWLLQKSSGIIPSIEIIYLDDEKRPDIFDFNVVRDMIISGLPGLFRSALDIILLRRLPEIMNDKNLCGCCKFKDTCKEDMKKIFDSKFKLKTKRRGASLLSLMVFFMAAIIITSQVFFFSNISSQAVKEDRDIQSARMQLASVVEDLKILLQKGQKYTEDTYSPNGTPKQRNWGISFFKSNDIQVDCDIFYDATRAALPTKTNIAGINPPIYFDGIHDTFSMDVHDLNYNYKASTWVEKPVNEKIFPAMQDHYLIRVSKLMPAGNRFMVQVLVKSTDKVFKTKTYEEIWYEPVQN